MSKTPQQIQLAEAILAGLRLQVERDPRSQLWIEGTDYTDCVIIDGSVDFDQLAALLIADGYQKQPEPEIEWGTATKWGHKPSMSRQNALDYIELCKQCGDEAKLIKRPAAIAPGPWEPAE